MRKQYHFQPSGNGYYAWDIDRLIEMSKELKPIEISLDSIHELDENYWYKGKNDIPTCRSIVEHMKLINEVDFTYPIILSSKGKIFDGMHRIAKALLENRKVIEAVQFTKDPAPDYEDVYPDELQY